MPMACITTTPLRRNIRSSSVPPAQLLDEEQKQLSSVGEQGLLSMVLPRAGSFQPAQLPPGCDRWETAC